MTRRRAVLLGIGGWLLVSAALHVLVFADAGRDQRSDGPTGAALWAGPWVQYDSWQYVAIADGDAYEADEPEDTRAVWFPGYALLIAAVHTLVSPITAAAVVAAALSGAAAIAMLAIWSRDRGQREAIPLTLAVALLYPYAWFLYGGAYSTPMLVALSIGAFWALEEDRRWVAAALGATALATHPMGLALFVGLVVREAERVGALVHRPKEERDGARPFALDRPKLRLLSPLVFAPLLGLVAYSAYLGARHGSPLLWLTARSAHSGTPLHDIPKIDFVTRLFTWSDPRRLMTTVVQCAYVVVVARWVPGIGRRFGWGYAAYVAALLAMVVLATADFNGAGRYLLAAFPAAAYGAERLRGRAALATGYLLVSGSLLVTFTLLFGRSWYLT